MDDAQKAAYVMAQAACLLAEVAGMQSENRLREIQGASPAYGEEAFQAAILRSGVHHNGVMSTYFGG